MQNYKNFSTYARKSALFRQIEPKNVRYCILLTTSFGELLFKIGKALFQLLNGYTQEAISSLQLPTTLEQPAKVSRCRLWTEVGLTLLRACPIFFVTSCFYALRFGLAMLGLRALCEQKQAPSAKSGKKSSFFHEIGQNCSKIDRKLTDSGVIYARNDLLRELFAANVQIQLILAL